MKLYMAVTADKYELPVAVEDNIKILAQKYEMVAHDIHKYIQRGSVKRKFKVKFVRVEI